MTKIEKAVLENQAVILKALSDSMIRHDGSLYVVDLIRREAYTRELLRLEKVS